MKCTTSGVAFALALVHFMHPATFQDLELSQFASYAAAIPFHLLQGPPIDVPIPVVDVDGSFAAKHCPGDSVCSRKWLVGDCVAGRAAATT